MSALQPDAQHLLTDSCCYLGLSSDWMNSSRSLKPCRFFESPRQQAKIEHLSADSALLLVLLLSTANSGMLLPASHLLSLLALHMLLSFHMIGCTRLCRSPSQQHSRQSSAVTKLGDWHFAGNRKSLSGHSITCPMTAKPIRPILDIVVSCFLQAQYPHHYEVDAWKLDAGLCNHILLRELFGSCYS